ncbi:ABC transporter ATP-binding protein [Actinacidiphila paucisporea]|uniref:Putative ABC transport system ATP-binding protein n=1 Tax=Actinacidiphila paucisporea TaxID=310782 RepID=A0A1M7C438_9ACTN|nr:ABC transporter ATP-binding protein [Actinacidiphila paucisporea]SHL61995.1 putative ABC transport system ATP-binding protein [Actinacidiphila paucisporea]
MTGTNGTSMADHALDARDLYRFFRAGEEETLALRGVSLHVARGETVAVIGPSGSGKSTLLACLAGLDEPAGGTVHIAGERLSHRPESERARLRAQHIGVVTQSGNLVAHLSVRDNIRLARSAARGKSSQPMTELLERTGLAHRAHALPRQLSGGELARAGLAVALANDPDVLLADEPTGELDGSTERRILDLLRAHRDTSRGVLLVTHSRQALRIADRVISLDDGRILDDER